MLRIAGSYVVIAVMGVIVAAVGGATHRAWPPIGVALCLLMVASAAVFARAWRGFPGLVFAAAPWAVVTMVLATIGPGGSLLINDDAVGLAWVFGGAAIISASAVVPRRVLEGEPTP